MKRFIAITSGAMLFAFAFNPAYSADNRARATLEAKSGSSVAGTVDFAEKGDKVQVTVKVTGLPPNTEHGFHVHEKGDCSSPDGMSAGGHFNPDGNPHARGDAQKRHTGDMLNVVADGKGAANVSFEFDTIRLDAGNHGIIDRAVIIHANPDDYVSQPVGNAGGRLACGLIKKL